MVTAGDTATPGPGDPDADVLARAVADAVSDVVSGTIVQVRGAPGTGAANFSVTLAERFRGLLEQESDGSLGRLVDAIPDAAERTWRRFRSVGASGPAPGASLRRALRDEVATEILAHYLGRGLDLESGAELIGETIEYLLELSATRVEAHALTHGVLIADVWTDTPKLLLRYPRDVRPAKRAPLLFDGQRSVLVVDGHGRARSELHAQRLRQMAPGAVRTDPETSPDTGSLVAAASGVLGGIGLFLRADRSIWSFADGQPLLVRRGGRWTAFPLRLSTSLATLIGDEQVAGLLAETALLISSQPHGAILAVVDRAEDVAGVIPVKDRYDLRHAEDPAAMRTETRLHHLIDTEHLDEHTLARLATLDGATILDRRGNLVAYGAIVSATDSEHEGARTAAARTLSLSAVIALKVSVDGDITIFEKGTVVTTLLGNPASAGP